MMTLPCLLCVFQETERFRDPRVHEMTTTAKILRCPVSVEKE